MNGFNIKEADLSELEQLISIYPWYQEARVELILRLSQISKETAREKLREFYSFLPFPDWIASKIEKAVIAKERSENDKVIKSEIQSARQIFVVGADYFSKEDLASVSRADNTQDSPVIPVEEARSLEKERLEKKVLAKKELSPLAFYTETLAQIYTQQECWSEALDVYSKLILLYPEKSAYFANLVSDIKYKMSSLNR